VEAPPAPQVQRVRVMGSIQAANLVRRVDPVYPPLALQARIQGTVRFTAIISQEGRVLNVQLVSGHPLLVESARQVVGQWEYRPTLLNGSPVEVVTQIDVNFTLP
jgi:protein TonB